MRDDDLCSGDRPYVTVAGSVTSRNWTRSRQRGRERAGAEGKVVMRLDELLRKHERRYTWSEALTSNL